MSDSRTGDVILAMRRAGATSWPAAATAAFLAGLGVLLVVVALQWRNPALVGRWPLPQIAFLLLEAALVAAAAVFARRSTLLAIPAWALAVAAAVLAAAATFRAEALRGVLDLPPRVLRPAAAHVIAGFYDMLEARALARAGVAGLFLSPRNVRGRSVAAITEDIAALQALRRKAGLPPLWIAADQEGGIVATLSPPLPRPAPLGAAAGDVVVIAAEAREVGRQLAAVGVDVDFAPVVDVTRGAIDPGDRNSRIALRSLSSNPEVVTRGADAYCRGLEAEGVRCTIKHFPGLGAVTADTHVASAHLPSLDARDIAPFQRLLASGASHPWVMLGHVAIDAIDPTRPASASPALVALLRGTLGDTGVVVTDDAAMAPYRAALATHAVATLKGGADLVLASWNPDVALEVIRDLADAVPRDAALASAMAASDARLGEDRRLLQGTK